LKGMPAPKVIRNAVAVFDPRKELARRDIFPMRLSPAYQNNGPFEPCSNGDSKYAKPAPPYERTLEISRVYKPRYLLGFEFSALPFRGWIIFAAIFPQRVFDSWYVSLLPFSCVCGEFRSLIRSHTCRSKRDHVRVRVDSRPWRCGTGIRKPFGEIAPL